MDTVLEQPILEVPVVQRVRCTCCRFIFKDENAFNSPSEHLCVRTKEAFTDLQLVKALYHFEFPN